jgi:hypothetical protein
MGTGSWHVTETLPTPARYNESPQGATHNLPLVILGPTPGTVNLPSQHPFTSCVDLEAPVQSAPGRARVGRIFYVENCGFSLTFVS